MDKILNHKRIKMTPEEEAQYLAEQEYFNSPQFLIPQLKSQLAESDYKVHKCEECNLCGLPLPYDIQALHAERQALRDEINRLEQQILQERGNE